VKRTICIVLLAACGKSSAPPTSGSAGPAPAPPSTVAGGATTCASVVSKLESLRNAPQGSLDALATDCEQWSLPYRECLLKIATRDEIPACDREALLARGVDLGGPDCENVIDHFVEVEKMPGDVYAKSKTKLIASCAALPRAVKECSLAATDHAGLVACAAANHETAR
jgi:hypothetical protein